MDTELTWAVVIITALFIFCGITIIIAYREGYKRGYKHGGEFVLKEWREHTENMGRWTK